MKTFEQLKTTDVTKTKHSESVASFRARRQAFRRLREAGCFVIPNPWDVGSARYRARQTNGV